MNVLVSYRSRRACANCTCSSIMMQGANSPKNARVVPMPAKAGRSSRVARALKAKTGMTPCRRGCNPSPDEERGEKAFGLMKPGKRSEEHTSDLQSLMRISYDVFCLKKKINPIILI